MKTKSLYVGNLSYGTTEADLRQLFEEYGPVSEVRIVEGRGFGFVDVPTEKMDDAINGVNGKEINGRALTVNEARPKAPRRSGGFERGGRRRERW